mgnify:CR=1 FL=1
MRVTRVCRIIGQGGNLLGGPITGGWTSITDGDWSNDGQRLVLEVLTGAVVIETVFAIPGLGRYFVQGALNRDYPLVLAVVTIYAGLIILFNLFADLLYGWLDPRARG